MWLIVLIVIGGLLFVLFRKPELKSAGAHWIPPEQREAEAKANAADHAAQE
jgi:hypothetical protein